MKKKLLPFFVAVGLIVLMIAAVFGARLIEKYIPSKEQADLKALLGAEENQTALFLNDELQEDKGIYVDGLTYLPIDWVNACVNDRFYWDESEKTLIYVLPETVVYADSKTVGSTGKPLIWVTDDNVYLSLGLILSYTDVRITAYDTGELKRVFIDSRWEPEQKALVSKAGRVRVKGGIKSPIITSVQKSSSVAVLESLEEWAKVRTEDGFIGYIESRRLGQTEPRILTSTYQAPDYKSISLGEEVCLVWHQVTDVAANKAMEELLADAKGVNVISPTWYKLTDNEGNYTSYASKEYVDKAHEMGLQVWALIDNFDNNVSTEKLMSKMSNRKKLIASLMGEADTYQLDGINLDVEGISKDAGPHYVQFIREMSVACRKKGVILSVDNAVPAASNRHYNRKEQGVMADYVIVMGYDEHYAGGSAGSVASLKYVKDGIENTLAQGVPKEKVINGVPFYTRVWTDADGKVTSSAIGIARAKEWVSENQVELYWQEELGQYYGDIVTDQGKRMVWLEEERSLGLKMDLIRSYGLAGVAGWKLGFEPAEVWDVIGRGSE